MHTIRLRHPWQSETNGDTTIWSRKFNWPAGLESGEVVQLVVEPTAEITSMSLNGQLLADERSGRFEITSLIAGHNRLTISSEPSQGIQTQSCPFEVRLEIMTRE